MEVLVLVLRPRVLVLVLVLIKKSYLHHWLILVIYSSPPNIFIKICPQVPELSSGQTDVQIIIQA